MIRRHITTLIALLLVVSLAAFAVPAVGADNGDDDCSFPHSAEDATGTTVTVEEYPERIVVLQPSAAQTVWELDAADRVVGAPVVPYTEYLEGIEERENVIQDDLFSVNQEAVVELDADIVLAPNVVSDETIESLREADQTVFKFGFGTSLDFVAEKTELTGRLIGSCEAAAETNEEYFERIETVSAQAETLESPRVLHFSDNFTAGSGTFIDELVTTAGGVNVAAAAGVTGYEQLNDEAVVEWNPDVIVVSDVEGGVPSTVAYDSTFAVQNDQVVLVNSNYLSQPGPLLVVALEQIADGLASAERAPEETADDTADDDGATDGDGAGVGAIAAVAALLAALCYARRP